MDAKSFIFGIVVSLVATAIISGIGKYRKYSLKQDIEILEFEKEMIEGIKKSSVELNRTSFRAIFAFFALMSLANIAPIVVKIIEFQDYSIYLFVEFSLWVMALFGAIKLWKRYDNLKNYKEAIKKLDQRILKKRERLEG